MRQFIVALIYILTAEHAFAQNVAPNTAYRFTEPSIMLQRGDEILMTISLKLAESTGVPPGSFFNPYVSGPCISFDEKSTGKFKDREETKRQLQDKLRADLKACLVGLKALSENIKDN